MPHTTSKDPKSPLLDSTPKAPLKPDFNVITKLFRTDIKATLRIIEGHLQKREQYDQASQAALEHHKGACLFRLGQKTDAYNAFQRFLNMGYTNAPALLVDAHIGCADIDMKEERYATAGNHLEICLKHAPNHADATKKLAALKSHIEAEIAAIKLCDKLNYLGFQPEKLQKLVAAALQLNLFSQLLEKIKEDEKALEVALTEIKAFAKSNPTHFKASKWHLILNDVYFYLHVQIEQYGASPWRTYLNQAHFHFKKHLACLEMEITIITMAHTHSPLTAAAKPDMPAPIPQPIPSPCTAMSPLLSGVAAVSPSPPTGAANPPDFTLK